MSITRWSEWHPLDLQSLKVPVPNSPGIYEVRTDFEFGRLRGSSSIIYIGSATPSLKKRLLDERIGKPDRYLSRAEKWLRQAGHALEFRYATLANGPTARRLEADRLRECEEEHWELPPGNASLPRMTRGAN